MLIALQSATCGHTVFASSMALEDVDRFVSIFTRSRCDRCGQIAEAIVANGRASELDRFAGYLEARSSFNYLGRMKQEDVMRAQDFLKLLGGTSPSVLEGAREYLLQRVPAQIEAALRLIPVGATSTWTPNAYAVEVPNGSVPVIVCDWSLCHYVYAMTRFLFCSFSLGVTERMPSGVLCEPPLPVAEALRGTLLSALQFSTGAQLVERFPHASDQYRFFTMCITRNVEAFVLAHEYAHCALEHIPRLRQIGFSEGRSSRYYLRARSLEKEADRWAMDVLAGLLVAEPRHAQGAHEWSPAGLPYDDKMFTLAAPGLFMLYGEFLERIRKAVPATLTRNAARHAGLVLRVDELTQHSAPTPVERDYPSFQERYQELKETISITAPFECQSLLRSVERRLAEFSAYLEE
jgi:hypothetical protein